MKFKKNLIRIIITVLFLIVLQFFKDYKFLFLIPYLIIGYDILIKSFKNILKGQVFDEKFLMSIASMGAFIIGEVQESVAVLLFFQIGELFEKYAVNNSRKSIKELMNILPEYANIEENGRLVQVDPYLVSVGDIIVVKPGEKIPLDGVIIGGSTNIDASSLTGESIPKRVAENDCVVSGTINLESLIRVKVTKEFDNSTVSKILNLVENASDKKSNAENFITRFARYYTPIVVFSAIALFIIPPVIFGESFSKWAYRALTFLVVSCPCALVISVPLTFFGGIGCASKNGILIKGSNFIERLTKVKNCFFDKTGTITKGNFVVTKVNALEITEDKLLEIAANLEYSSNHPISKAIVKYYAKDIDLKLKSKEIPGFGIEGEIDGSLYFIGNKKLMEKNNITVSLIEETGSIVYIGCDNKFLGYIVISDEIKEESYNLCKSLKGLGINSNIMLTGDNRQISDSVGKKLGFDKVYSQLLPQDKVGIIEEYKDTLFVGDGINDAPVLALCDVGVAMGAMGSDAAIEAADIVILDDDISKIIKLFQISKKTLNIVKENIVISLGVKFAVLLLSIFGLTNMYFAVFADVGVCVIAILNAMRILKNKKADK